MAVRIIIDSSCDYTFEQAKQLKLDILPLKTIFGDVEYLDGVNITHEEFYKKLSETKQNPTTSQISPAEYGEIFEKVKADGDSAVCITVSAKLSGCYQSANIALEGYEDIIHIVDSASVAIGEQLLIERAIELRDKGASAVEIADILNGEKDNIRVITLLDTLEYLRRGGRISATSAIAGGVLSIKPVVAVEDGLLTVLGKARGSKNGQNLLREYAAKYGIDYSRNALLAYTGLSDELINSYVADSADLHAPFGRQLKITTIGSTIGTHAGPGAIAVAFWAKK